MPEAVGDAANGEEMGIHILSNHPMLVCSPHKPGVLQGQLGFVSWLPCDQRLDIRLTVN